MNNFGIQLPWICQAQDLSNLCVLIIYWSRKISCLTELIWCTNAWKQERTVTLKQFPSLLETFLLIKMHQAVINIYSLISKKKFRLVICDNKSIHMDQRIQSIYMACTVRDIMLCMTHCALYQNVFRIKLPLGYKWAHSYISYLLVERSLGHQDINPDNNIKENSVLVRKKHWNVKISKWKNCNQIKMKIFVHS